MFHVSDVDEWATTIEVVLEGAKGGPSLEGNPPDNPALETTGRLSPPFSMHSACPVDLGSSPCAC
jgi:hypothetical protein